MLINKKTSTDNYVEEISCYFSCLIFCANKFLFLRKKPKNKKAIYSAILKPNINNSFV